MREYAWFRLALIAIGVLLGGLGIPSVLGALLSMAMTLSRPGTAELPTSTILLFGASVLPSLLQLGLGIALILKAHAIAKHFANRALNRCAICDFDVTATTATICPECGSPIPPRATSTS